MVMKKRSRKIRDELVRLVWCELSFRTDRRRVLGRSQTVLSVFCETKLSPSKRFTAAEATTITAQKCSVAQPHLIWLFFAAVSLPPDSITLHTPPSHLAFAYNYHKLNFPFHSSYHPFRKANAIIAPDDSFFYVDSGSTVMRTHTCWTCFVFVYLWHSVDEHVQY